MKHNIGIGDLVRVKGYADNYFVDTITERRIINENTEEFDVEFDLTDMNGRYSLAYIEDVVLICRAKYADEYLRTGILTERMKIENEDDAPRQLKNTMTPAEQAQYIDELLDDALFAQGAYKATGLSDFEAKERAAYELIEKLQKETEA
ncbi:hypothetical protein [Paenilisteria rocourtiae]|uniref:Uncharacterized protein n=1 Tax=Listeria rocourtiae TaxID=647910 RepID=A0A4R6ZN63_9LIST|nr:hypothetical protein [Listeria rocourtiae]EUJ42550.1 hypothetical protein PROCOU_16894 [Listeria rocourtiae FSL F6-920]TDR53920.1 hypothetical protein DFP96_10314 [Listeria rocourtiae]